MQQSTLPQAWQKVRIGQPMPFSVRDIERTLLLARGQVIDNRDQLVALQARAVFFDEEAAPSAQARVQHAAPEELPALWSASMEGVGNALRSSQQEHFVAALDDAAEPVLALIERDPDLAIFQVVRQKAGAQAEYGVTHSVHAAITSRLVADRLGWDAARQDSLFKAALTMNLAMIDLQGTLAQQTAPLTPEQRSTIASHPQRSVEMLEASGITDRAWLEAVLQHHEQPDGTGYPAGLREVSDIAALLRRADIYTAKLSARSTRSAMAANRAGREIFMQDPQHPMNSAIVKEFGVYPPGCYVRLACGETGIVIKRGVSANTPIVASLSGRRGETLTEPVRRDTAQREHVILDVVGEQTVRVRVAPEKLAAMACA